MQRVLMDLIFLRGLSLEYWKISQKVHILKG